ncbi:MAG: hypothetical protein AAF591_22025 [Verrucomicrobiota bacterium]
MTDPPPSPSSPTAPPKKRSCLKAATLTLLLALAATLATAWFARGWLTSKAETALLHELKKHNLHVEYTNASFSLRHQALVLNDVTLFRDPEHTQPFFSLSHVDAALTISTTPSATLETNDATLTVDTGKSKPTFDSLDARIHITPGAVKIEQFDTLFQGLAVKSSGDLAYALPKPDPNTSTTPAAKDESTPDNPPTKFDLTKVNLAPLDKLVDFIAISSEHSPPILSLDFKSDLAAKTHAVSGKLSGEHFTYRDLNIEKIDIPFQYNGAPDQGSLTLQSATLNHDGQPLTLDGTFELPSRTLKIEKFSSTADLITLASSTSPQLATHLESFAFDPPPAITASGTLPLKTPDNADLTLSIAGENSLKFTVNDRSLSLNQLSADFTIKEGILKSDNITAELFKGTLTAKTSSHLFESLSFDSLDIDLKNASRQYLESFLGNDKKMEGTFNVHFEGQGPPSLEGITGHAHIEAFNANFYTIPIFGNLAEMFKKLIPSFSHEEDSSLSADVNLNQGTLTSDNIEIHSSGTTINATANVNLPGRHLVADATVRLGGNGIVGATTSLLGKALEIEAKGSFDHIKWRFKNVPGMDQFQGMADLTGDLTQNTIGLLGGAAGKVLEAGSVPGEALKDTAKGAADAVKSLFKGLTPKKEE